REVALRRAAAEWPGNRPGPVVPYLDEDGAMAAWMFLFRCDGREFPESEAVEDDARALREKLGPGADLSRPLTEYGYVLVSAREDRAPVLCFGRGFSEFHALGRRAVERAAARLGAGAGLSRLYLVFPKVYLEVTGPGGETVVFGSHFEQEWESREAFRADVARKRAALAEEYPVDREETTRRHREEWQRALAFEPRDYSEHYVPGYDRAPFYDWSYGCTPTSAAIVMGWIDRTQNYGRLVDWFWQRYDMVEGQMDWQIPNVQRECALAMYTDTTTGGTMVNFISPGLRQVGNDNGYSFTTVSQMGGSYNDWAWSTITSEVNSGFGFVWSALWEIHSLALFGYRTDDQYVYVHNTWWQPAAWWAHSGPDWSYVDSPHPSGGDPKKLELTFPLGDTFYGSHGRGEVFQVGDTVPITWTNNGNPGTRVDIDWSTNGGRTWQALVGNLPDNGSHGWFLDSSMQALDTVRLRLKQYSNSTYTSGDATFGSFALNREPRPPVSLAPPNGRQLFDPPVILLVDSTREDIDSFDFRVLQSTDTIWRERGTSPVCALPDSLFIYGRSYKWLCRAWNTFGWGPFGAPWSFWCRFQSGVEEAPGAAAGGAFEVATVAGGPVRFALAAPVPGAVLVVYDALGARVRELGFEGRELAWDRRDGAGRRVMPGLYFARLEAGSGTETRKLVLLD
ncbi:hypothetical protein JXB37_03945, partial [candidate division WOR-3 bacterium]|nr:hypothetical protein [candidate division WOR-3 bacterium]